MIDEDPAALIREGRLDEYVALMPKLVARAHEVAARRPGWDELAGGLFRVRLVVQADLLEQTDGPMSPIELRSAVLGSAFEQESRRLASSTINAAHALLRQELRAGIGAISDHLHGLGAVMVSEPPVRPAFVLNRVLLDLSLRVLYLLEPDIDAEERTARAANIRLRALFEALGDPSEKAEQDRDEQKEIQDVYARGAVDGIARVLTKKGEPGRYFLPPPPMTGDITSSDLPGSNNAMWRLLSSVVHGQDRDVMRFIAGRGDIAQSVQGRAQSALHLGHGVLATTQAVQRLAVFIGRSTTDLRTACDELNLLWAAASGMDDARIHAQMDSEGWAPPQS